MKVQVGSYHVGPYIKLRKALYWGNYPTAISLGLRVQVLKEGAGFGVCRLS